MWFFLGGALSWPIATRVGRSMQTFRGGVARVPNNRLVEEWFEVAPHKTNVKLFKMFSFLTVFTSGYMLANYMTDQGRFLNPDYTRPDFRPKAAMVKDQSSNYEDYAAE